MVEAALAQLRESPQSAVTPPLTTTPRPDTRDLALNLARAYFNRGLAYLDKGQFDHAIKAFDEASRRFDLNDARAYYEQADLARVYYKRSNAYARKGEYGRSIQDFKRALQIDPNYPLA